MNQLPRPRCPACDTPLNLDSKWFGFVRETPPQCAHCNALLLFDGVGGVYAFDPDTKEPLEANRRGGITKSLLGGKSS